MQQALVCESHARWRPAVQRRGLVLAERFSIPWKLHPIAETRRASIARAERSSSVMGKHETGFERADRDLYPTPAWAVAALAEHFELADKSIWECAAGTGTMVEALKAAGAPARAYCTDIIARDYPLDGLFDFTGGGNPPVPPVDLIVTNPPFGRGNRLAVKFIEAGLRRIVDRGTLALLLPVDFDSAKTRSHLFRDNPYFTGKVVLTRRIVWFERNDGKKEAPKENHAWFIWSAPVLKTRRMPVVMYAPMETE
jgi:hypothetical protein